jgi:transcriptional regulator with XRE-family HTH domain
VKVVLYAEIERRKRGLTQKELARRCCVTQQEVSDAEKGMRRTHVLKALSDFFGMKPELLIKPVPASINFLAAQEQAREHMAHMPEDAPRRRDAFSTIPQPANTVPSPRRMSEVLREEREEG